MPFSRIDCSCSSVTPLPCSIESTPASIAVWMAIFVWAWAATFLRARCASSAIALRIDGEIPTPSSSTLDARGPEIAHGGEAGLQVLARHLRADEDTLRRRLGGHREEEPWLKCRIARHLRLRWHADVEQQMSMRIDQAGHQCRSTEIDDRCSRSR